MINLPQAAVCSRENLLFAEAMAVIFSPQGVSDDIAVQSGVHEAETREFISFVDADPRLKFLLEKSLLLAKAANPDPRTNPAQTLEGFYDFLDWSVTCMPWNMLPQAEAVYSPLFDQIAQSLNYFYFVLDQPLEELEGNGMYYNSLQYVEPFRSWIVRHVANWGSFLSRPESWNEEYYQKFLADDHFGLKKDWYESPQNWRTFNDFFSRRLKDENSRPVAAPNDDSVVVAGADSKPQGLWRVDENSDIVHERPVVIKSKIYNSIRTLLGGGSYLDAFAGGWMTHSYLNESDYHRYHFPVSGVVREAEVVRQDADGGGITVWDQDEGKYILQDQNPGWQSLETRGRVIVETGDYGLVAVMPIGMALVSSVNFEPSIHPGAAVKKGAPLGWFLFGGSDMVMIFQKCVKFSLDCQVGGHLLMGEKYGRLAQA